MSRHITTAIVAMVLVALVLAGIGTFVVARSVTRDREQVRLEQQARAIAELVPPGVVAERAERDAPGTGTGGATGTGRAATAAEARARLRARVAEIVQLTGVSELVLRPDGTVEGDVPRGVDVDALDAATLRSGGSVSGRRLTLVWAAAGRTDDTGRTTVVVVTARQEGPFGPTARWFTVFAVVGLALGGLGAWGLGRRLARPVHEATETTRRLAAGDLTARMPRPPAADDTDELAVLARSVDTLATELERSRGLERQFLLSVSHDLRTPLTSIRGYAEAISDGLVDDPGRAAEVIIDESRRLERLVGDLLDLAKLDARQFRLHPTEVGAGDLVAAAARHIEPQVTAAGLRLVTEDAAGDLRLLVDADRAVQAIGNLGANAVRFARTGLWLRARREDADDGRVVVAVDLADDGAGIRAADLPHVFERLYQADDQPRPHASGSGLGLAIVAELTEAMGGTVSVASEPGAGATFTLRFPALPPAGPPPNR